MLPFHWSEDFPAVRTVWGRVVRLPLGKPGGLDNNRVATGGVTIIKDDMRLKSLPVTVNIPKFEGRNVERIVASLTNDFTNVSHAV